MTVTRGEGGGQSSARRCTVSHVPPEVWSNVNLPSDRFYDIYSFGIIIWELLSGEFPYKGNCVGITGPVCIKILKLRFFLNRQIFLHVLRKISTTIGYFN